MTQEEFRFYNTLTPCWKQEFNDYKAKHPEWTLTQLMNRVSIGITLEGEDCKGGLLQAPPIGGGHIGDDPVFLKKLFQKANGWMGRNLPPDLYEAIKPSFESAIKKLDYYICKGIIIVKNLWDMICSIFN